MTVTGAAAYQSPTSRYSVSNAMNKVEEVGLSATWESSTTRTQVQSETSESSINGSADAFASPNASFQGRLSNLTLNKGSDLAVAKPVWERLSSEEYAEYQDTQRVFLEMQNRVLEHDYTNRPDDPNDPRLKPYANIVIGGKIVATIDNQGCVGTWNDSLGKRLAKLSEETTGLEGPELAKYLSEKIGEMLGGRVVIADTALTQSVYTRLVIAAQPTIDFDALKNDPRYAEIQKQYEQLAQDDINRSKYLENL